MTIKEAQVRAYGKAGRGLEKKIRRAVAAGTIKAPFGTHDPYTQAIADAIQMPGPAELSQAAAPASKSPKPTTRTRTRPKQTLKHKSKPAEPKQLVFENQYLFLLMLLAICLIDGISMSTVAKVAIGTSQLIQIGFFIAGTIVAYAGLQNAYTLSQKPHSKWDANPATSWIILFTLFQVILHGAAGNFFGSWNNTIGKALIATGIPMATAGLSVLLFQSTVDGHHAPSCSKRNNEKTKP